MFSQSVLKIEQGKGKNEFRLKNKKLCNSHFSVGARAGCPMIVIFYRYMAPLGRAILTNNLVMQLGLFGIYIYQLP